MAAAAKTAIAVACSGTPQGGRNAPQINPYTNSKAATVAELGVCCLPHRDCAAVCLTNRFNSYGYPGSQGDYLANGVSGGFHQ